MTKHHKILLISGVVLAGAGVLYYAYTKSTAKHTSSSISFIGKSPYVAADGKCCIFPACNKKKVYTEQDITTAQNNLIKNGATKMEATQMINSAMNECLSITDGSLCKQLICNSGCSGFCLCNPSKGISWYNPLSWHW